MYLQIVWESVKSVCKKSVIRFIHHRDSLTKHSTFIPFFLILDIRVRDVRDKDVLQAGQDGTYNMEFYKYGGDAFMLSDFLSRGIFLLEKSSSGQLKNCSFEVSQTTKSFVKRDKVLDKMEGKWPDW